MSSRARREGGSSSLSASWARGVQKQGPLPQPGFSLGAGCRLCGLGVLSVWLRALAAQRGWGPLQDLPPGTREGGV